MNERDYSIFTLVSILTGTIFLILGGYLFDLLGLLDYLNTIFLISVFIFFFFCGVYFNFKKDQLITESIDEIKKYINGDDDDFKSP